MRVDHSYVIMLRGKWSLRIDVYFIFRYCIAAYCIDTVYIISTCLYEIVHTTNVANNTVQLLIKESD